MGVCSTAGAKWARRLLISKQEGRLNADNAQTSRRDRSGADAPGGDNQPLVEVENDEPEEVTDPSLEPCSECGTLPGPRGCACDDYDDRDEE